MTNAKITRKFFNLTDRRTINKILDNIASNYGITRMEAMNEVLDDAAESLLDYVTGAERTATSLIMKRHGLA